MEHSPCSSPVSRISWLQKCHLIDRNKQNIGRTRRDYIEGGLAKKAYVKMYKTFASSPVPEGERGRPRRGRLCIDTRYIKKYRYIV